MRHTTTDPRVSQIGRQTWIDRDSKFIFEAADEGGTNLGVNVYNFRKGPGQQPPLNETPYQSLDEAIAEHLGDPA